MGHKPDYTYIFLLPNTYSVTKLFICNFSDFILIVRKKESQMYEQKMCVLPKNLYSRKVRYQHSYQKKPDFIGLFAF